MDKKLWIVFAVSVAMFVALFAAVFALAGTVELPFFWAVFGFQAFVSLIGFFVLDPELIKERIRPGGKDQDRWGPAIITVLYFVHIGLAALDAGRWHVSDQISPVVQKACFILYALGVLGMLWTMKTNQFFSSAIRLQKDRGQTVVSTGPYAYIRHPGYSFASVLLLSEAIALGSLISTIPSVILITLLLRRTFMEEKILGAELRGYDEYMHKVRYRWIPGVW